MGLSYALVGLFSLGVANAQTGLPGIGFVSSRGVIYTPTVSSIFLGSNGFICRAASILFWILIALTVVFVLVAAYKYLTSGGDEAKVSSATKTITYAAIAIVVALLARGFPFIVSSVIGYFGGTYLGASGPPLLGC